MGRVAKAVLAFFIAAILLFTPPPETLAGESGSANQSGKNVEEAYKNSSEASESETRDERDEDENKSVIVSIDPPEIPYGMTPLAGPSIAIIRISTGQGLGNTSVAVGGYNDNISMVVNEANIGPVTWSSGNPNVFSAFGNESVATISAIREGFGRLKLSAVTSEGETLMDEANVSIYTPAAQDAAGRTTTATDVYRGADPIATHRGQAPSGQRLTVAGECGSYYYALFPDTLEFTDGQPDNHYGYLLKSRVNIPATKVRVTPSFVDMAVSETGQFTAAVTPALATNRTVLWSIGDSSMATVNRTGRVSAKKSGVTSVKATQTESGVAGTSRITIYQKISSTAGNTTKSIPAWHSGDGTSRAETLSAGTPVTISGQCGNYWRIDKDRYVAKSAVDIPVTGITLDKTKATILEGASLKLNVKSIQPAIATNKTLKWSSSRKAVATVKPDGSVKSSGFGITTITATAASGRSASCELTVDPVWDIPGSALSPGKLSLANYPAYRYGFTNGDSDWISSGKRESSVKKKDLETFVKKTWEKYSSYYAERYTFESFKRSINKRIAKTEGSCFGMTATTVLNRMEKIKVRAYPGIKSKNGKKLSAKGNNLNDLAIPKKNASLKSLINYYQLSTDEFVKDVKQFGPDKEGNEVNSFESGCDRLLYYGKTKKRAALFWFVNKSGYCHAILVLSYKEKASKNSKYYYFDTYDPNDPTSKTYLRITKGKNPQLQLGHFVGPLPFRDWGIIVNFKFVVNMDRFNYLLMD